MGKKKLKDDLTIGIISGVTAGFILLYANHLSASLKDLSLLFTTLIMIILTFFFIIVIRKA